MSKHLHREHIEGCFQCDLSREEERQYEQYTTTTEEVEDGYAYGEWDTDPDVDEVPRRDAFRRWHAAELRRAKAEALREAAEDLDESTQADVNNYIDRPSPTFSHSERYADVLWLSRRADQIEEAA